jgi:hypothetical protein
MTSLRWLASCCYPRSGGRRGASPRPGSWPSPVSPGFRRPGFLYRWYRGQLADEARRRNPCGVPVNVAKAPHFARADPSALPARYGSLVAAAAYLRIAQPGPKMHCNHDWTRRTSRAATAPQRPADLSVGRGWPARRRQARVVRERNVRRDAAWSGLRLQKFHHRRPATRLPRQRCGSLSLRRGCKRTEWDAVGFPKPEERHKRRGG